MQRVLADWTTRSEAQTGCLQAIVVASGFPPSIAGAHCCAECKVWTALIKKDMFDLLSPTMYQLFFGLWRGPQSLKTIACAFAIQEPTCLCNKRPWEPSSVLTGECESAGPILTRLYWALHGPKVGHPGLGHQLKVWRGRSPKPLCSPSYTSQHRASCIWRQGPIVLTCTKSHSNSSGSYTGLLLYSRRYRWLRMRKLRHSRRKGWGCVCDWTSSVHPAGFTISPTLLSGAGCSLTRQGQYPYSAWGN